MTTCSVCDTDLPPGAMACPLCRTPAVRAAPRARHAPAPVPDRDTGVRCPATECGHVNEPHAVRCFYCSTPLPSPSPSPSAAPAARARLVLPWGEAVLSAGSSVVVGRADSPFAERLTEYPNVSRRHAVLSCAEHLTVVDERSTNGTTVNGRSIEPGREVPLQDGDVLGFGADLRAQVRIP